MLFWFKKKITVLDCFTSEFAAYDKFKVDKAVRYLPEWYKKLDKGNPYIDPTKPLRSTMKKCAGFLDYFKNSFALPAWDYIYFRISESDVGSSLNNQRVTSHSSDQYGTFLDPTFKHFKIVPPWLIHSNNKVKAIQTFSPWCYSPNHNPEKLMHLPGVVDFYYQNSTNVNLFIRKAVTSNEPSIITFEPGVPLVFYTPLEDIRIKFKYHLISESEYKQRELFISHTPGINRLKINREFIDKRDEEKKCPFGFGKNNE
jgi:hypothetical protein